ncbi:neutral amino acid uniporter 4-like isoform X2 [Sycon ciliatum]|uniref:neutral amino acid uniporter 4-like isoform X2 n=1 Tax=Sycon ciliatum TaxID=27933 RepID=UPI0031F68551
MKDLAGHDIHLKNASDLEGDQGRADGTSAREAFFHVLKGNVGTGLLGLPSAFAFAGLPMGFIGMVLICILAVHCMFLLVRCATRLRESRKQNDTDLHYAKVAELAFQHLPAPICHYSRVGKFVVNMFIIMTQFGLCCVYVLFVAANVQQVLAACGFNASKHMIVLFSLILFIPGSFLRSLKHLAPLSGVATIVQVISIFIIFFYLVTHTNISEVNLSPTKPALFFGVAVFSMEGICLVLPLENDMRDRKQFPASLGGGMLLTCVLYLAMGTLGAIAFRQPKGSITLDLPSDGVPENIPYIYVRLFYAFSIFATYFVQLYVPLAIVHRKIIKYSGRLERFAPYFVRVVFVGITAVIAIVVPRLDLAISLVGSFSSSALALIFPPILELIIFWNERTPFMLVKDIFITAFGLLGMIVGTVNTLREMAA